MCVYNDRVQVMDAPDTCTITTTVLASAVVCFATHVDYAYSGERRDIGVIVKMKRLLSSDILVQNGRECISSFIRISSGRTISSRPSENICLLFDVVFLVCRPLDCV